MALPGDQAEMQQHLPPQLLWAQLCDPTVPRDAQSFHWGVCEGGRLEGVGAAGRCFFAHHSVESRKESKQNTSRPIPVPKFQFVPVATHGKAWLLSGTSGDLSMQGFSTKSI